MADMLPIIADTSFNRLCMVDDYTSFIWTTRYYDAGDFELSVPLTCDDLQYLQIGNYVIRDGVDDVGIIESREVTQDVNNNEIMVVSGRFLTSILGRRIIARQTQVSGTVAACIAKLLNENAINPADAARALPLQIGMMDVPAASMQQQFTGTNLLEAIQEISKTYGIGFHVVLGESNAMTFEMFTGLDRSYDQSANTYAVFSSEFGNMESADYVEDASAVVTNVLVAGEGEGAERKTIWATRDAPQGLARYEVFQDARNASTNNGEISDAVYYAQLRDEGMESLADLQQLFAGKVTFNNIEYGKDLYVGDICVIESVRWGIYMNARLVEIIESIGESGEYSITPTFDSAITSASVADANEYIMTETALDMLTEHGAGPLLRESATFEPSSSEYGHAVKISELDELATLDDGYWLPVATDTDTRKLSYSVLKQLMLDYELLQNKPQIESVTLSGNKGFADFNLTRLTNTEIESLLS